MADLSKCREGDEERQVRLEQADHAIQRQHKSLIPLLLLAVAAVVHQHLDADSAQLAKHLRICLKTH